MPFEGEFARHEILRKFEHNPQVKKLIGECVLAERDIQEITTLNVQRRTWSPSYVFAIDGSHRELVIETGFPGAAVGFISVATVLIDMSKLVYESSKPTIDPVAFDEVESAYAVTAALPSANVVRTGQPDARSSFRHAWFELLRDTHPIEGGESLLNTYEAVLAHQPLQEGLRCPLMDLCSAKNTPHPNLSTGQCACEKHAVYPTDALRIHERFYDYGVNGESFGEAMRLMEHLTLLNYLRYIETRAAENPIWWSIFSDTGFILDGSLAIFGHAAWLSERVLLELRRLNVEVNKHTGLDLLVLGIEKSGRFFDHWCQLDHAQHGKRIPRKHGFEGLDDFDAELFASAPSQTVEHSESFIPSELLRGRLAPGEVMLLDNSYIRQCIAVGPKDSIHGASTYYGRPFLYKTRNEAMIVGISPMLRLEDEDRTTAQLEQFPRLADTLDLLDALISMRYPNAVIPLMAAHAHAAIPVQMGDKMFEALVQQHFGKSV